MFKAEGNVTLYAKRRDTFTFLRYRVATGLPRAGRNRLEP